MTDTFPVQGPTVEVRHIDAIRPYWRNPRKITDRAVDAVKDSIERYGYQQPIVVDPDGVIVTGHTRYAALRKLGAEQVPVIVADLPEAKIKEYRVLDNRVSELTDWAHDDLVAELREFDAELLSEYFAFVDLEVGTEDSLDDITADEIDKAAETAKTFAAATVHDTRSVTCPNCFSEFELRTDSI